MKPLSFFLCSALILMLRFSSFSQQVTTNDTLLKSNYAMLYVGYYGLHANKANIVYDNGENIDLVKKKIVNIRDKFYVEENFVEICKAFKLLNDKGYQLRSYACYDMSGSTICSYIFVK